MPVTSTECRVASARGARLTAYVTRRFDEQMAAGPQRIADWYARGYVWFSDRENHSTHLRRVSGDECRVSSETHTSNPKKGGPS